MNTVVLVSNPSEVGAGTRGSSLGFNALEVAGWNRKSDLLKRYEVVEVEHNNSSIYDPDPTPFAHRIAAIREVFEKTADVIAPVLVSGRFPLAIGGDHSVAAGTISSIRKAFPDKRLGVVWIDAHADLHTPYTTPSGNFHGMPLAIVIGEDNLQERKNTPVAQTVQEWNEVKNLWGMRPKVLPQDVVFFGVRDTEAEEDAMMERLQMRNYIVGEIRSKGMGPCLDEAVARLSGCDLVYISFDVDSMDPQLTSHGTGTPVANGFSPSEALLIIQGLFDRLPVCCFEMVEINPTLDEKKNRMAEVAFEVLTEVVKIAEAATPAVKL